MALPCIVGIEHREEETALVPAALYVLKPRLCIFGEEYVHG